MSVERRNQATAALSRSSSGPSRPAFRPLLVCQQVQGQRRVPGPAQERRYRLPPRIGAVLPQSHDYRTAQRRRHGEFTVQAHLPGPHPNPAHQLLNHRAHGCARSGSR